MDRNSTSTIPSAADGCTGATTGAVVDGVITVTCGADSGPGTLREAAELSSASITPVKVVVAPEVKIIELETGIIFRTQIDLNGDEQSPPVIRPSEGFPDREILVNVIWGENSQVQGSVAHIHFDLESRAEVGLAFSFEGHEMILDSLRVSGATRAGIAARAYDGGALTLRNSVLIDNGFGSGVGEFGGMVINDSEFEEAHASVLIENTEFRDNYQGLRADLWFDPDSADGSEIFEIRESRFIGNGSLEAGNEVGALVLPWAVGAAGDGTARLRVIDTLFEKNVGQAVGAIQLNSERGLKKPNPVGVSLLIDASTFVSNVSGTEEWLAPATDLAFASYGFAAIEAPDTVMQVQNSTLHNDGNLPSISVNEDSGEVVLDHVTVQGGGVVTGWEYSDISVHNSVFDSGANDAFETEAKAPEGAPPISNTATAFTKPGKLLLGDGSFSTTQEEIALGDITQGVGVTPTMVPQPGSVLLNAAHPSDHSLASDQRGLPRPSGAGAADIGAVEVQLGGMRMLGDVTVDEGESAEFTVELVHAGEHPMSVTAETSDGTAKAGTDYNATSASLSWAPGETGPQTVVVKTTADDIRRADRSFTVTLAAPSGADILEPGDATGTIVDVTNGAVVPPTPPKTPPTTPPTVPSQPGGDGTVGVKPPGENLSVTGSAQVPILWPLMAGGALIAGVLLARRGLLKSQA